MSEQPTLRSERLLLRPFRVSDALRVQQLAGDKEIAATTLNIPYPYEDGVAEQWIRTHPQKFALGEQATFAIVSQERDELIGAIGMRIDQQYERAEMGYWIGKPYWGKGYCTEAGRELLRYAFTELGLNRVYATHMTGNPASGRVMQKLGMQYEGKMRQHVKKWGVFEDLELYGLLREEWEAAGEAGGG